MDILDVEILNLWKNLNKWNVKYIMVGGFATNLHGFQRTTGDLDLWIKDSVENRKQLRNALRESGLGDIDSVETMTFLHGWSAFSLDSGFEIDIMTSLKGFEQSAFDYCFEIAPIAVVYDVPIKFLHLNQLIEAKKASGRPKDLIDIQELEKIKRENLPPG